jgi:hypothetical protein
LPSEIDMNTSIVIFFVVLLTVFCESKAQKNKLDIYYISVGSGHYNQDISDFVYGFSGLNDVPPACQSAQIVSAILNSCNPIRNVNLISNDTLKINTKQIIDSTINLLNFALTQIHKTKRSGTFIFYYCGHGLKANDNKELFLIPGDFKSETIRYVDVSKESEKNSKSLIEAKDVFNDILGKKKLIRRYFNFDELQNDALSVSRLLTSLFVESHKAGFASLNSSQIDSALDKLTFFILFDCCYNTAITNEVSVDSLINLVTGETKISKDVDNKKLVPIALNRDYNLDPRRTFVNNPYRDSTSFNDFLNSFYNIFYAAKENRYTEMIKTKNMNNENIEIGPICFGLYNLFHQKLQINHGDLLKCFAQIGFVDSYINIYPNDHALRKKNDRFREKYLRVLSP